MVQGNDSFCWQQADWGQALVCSALLPFAPHLFTTRALALGLDDLSHQRARQAVAHSLGLPSSAVTWARQVHGTAVVVASAGTGADRPLADADILLSDRPETAVSIRVADCVPILLADSRRGAVAAVHAGWRGTCAGAALVAVRAMAQRFGSSPGDLVAAVGPSIGPCCCQVGVEVRDAFRNRDGALPDDSAWFLADGERWRLDLWAATRDQLTAAGLPAGQVHLSRECTADALDRYYSYRAEASCAGRLMAAIRPAAAAR